MGARGRRFDGHSGERGYCATFLGHNIEGVLIEACFSVVFSSFLDEGFRKWVKLDGKVIKGLRKRFCLFLPIQYIIYTES